MRRINLINYVTLYNIFYLKLKFNLFYVKQIEIRGKKKKKKNKL